MTRITESIHKLLDVLLFVRVVRRGQGQVQGWGRGQGQGWGQGRRRREALR